jgi:hypothetical protein
LEWKDWRYGDDRQADKGEEQGKRGEKERKQRKHGKYGKHRNARERVGMER